MNTILAAIVRLTNTVEWKNKPIEATAVPIEHKRDRLHFSASHTNGY